MNYEEAMEKWKDKLLRDYYERQEQENEEGLEDVLKENEVEKRIRYYDNKIKKIQEKICSMRFKMIDDKNYLKGDL